MTTNETPTPRTDAIAGKWAGDPDARGYREELEAFARELERELASVVAAVLKRDGHDVTRMSAMDRVAELHANERKLAAERALADRLAGELESWAAIAGDYTPMDADKALAAWKEARNEAQ